jgi:alpha-tubulin suppressor-like RCC1 family protein
MTDGPVGMPIDLVKVTAGSSHACALDPSGVAYCWGNNLHGQLGQGVTGPPVPFATRVGDGTLTFTAIAAGDDHTCALRNGQAWCWGKNTDGQAAGAKGGDVVSPTAVAIGAAPPLFDQIAAGGHHSCAIGSGQLWCWGSGQETGTGNDPVVITRVSTLADWTAVALGDTHSCGISTSQGVSCWGDNSHLQVRGVAGADAPAPTPISVGGLVPTAISAGGNMSCAVVGAGELWCWGYNVAPTIDASGNDMPPTRIGTDSQWTGVSMGIVSVCGVQAGVRRCWGNEHGASLGDGVWDQAFTFAQSAVLEPVDEVVLSRDSNSDGTLSGSFGCLRQGTKVSCWGSNFSGEVGVGTLALAATPVAIPPPAGRTWAHVASADHEVCARAGDGSLWCWGDDWRGQISGTAGVGSSTQPCTPGVPCGYSRPIAAPVAAGVDDVVVGHDYACERSGTVVRCWDNNGVQTYAAPAGMWTKLTGGPRAPCGITTTADIACWGSVPLMPSAQPVIVPGAEVHNITDASIGNGYACLSRGSDNARVCWGDNTNYVLGDNTMTMQPTPIALDVGAVQTVASTYDQGGCAITPAGGITCWGINNEDRCGQPGNNSFTMTPAPVSDGNGPLAGCTMLAATGDHTCVICNDQLLCWGQNEHGELGRGMAGFADHIAAAPALPTAQSVVDITVTAGGGLAIDSAGQLFCWGAFENGECGVGTSGFTLPQPVLTR